jgi:uncharacterized protein (TIGR03000 family)
MYSLMLLTAMTTTPEASGFGDVWAKHCFWECCLPARYGWVDCGPGYAAYYPASYTSCCGIGGYGGGYGTGGYGCGCYGGCMGGGCIGGYYNCYGGGGGAWGNIWAGIGYAGFGAYGNYGAYNTLPYYSAPVYATPLFEPRPVEVKPPSPPKPGEKKKDFEPLEIRPIKTMNNSVEAAIVVNVPPEAKVFINDHLMRSQSTERTFKSPAIEPGATYFYTLRVVVEKDGKPVEDVRRVTVKAGEVSRLSFDNLFDRVRPEERTIADLKHKPIK